MPVSASSEPDWKHLEELFQRALDLPPHQRQLFITQSCNGDQRLEDELNSLLKSADDDDEFLQKFFHFFLLFLLLIKFY